MEPTRLGRGRPDSAEDSPPLTPEGHSYVCGNAFTQFITENNPFYVERIGHPTEAPIMRDVPPIATKPLQDHSLAAHIGTPPGFPPCRSSWRPNAVITIEVSPASSRNCRR